MKKNNKKTSQVNNFETVRPNMVITDIRCADSRAPPQSVTNKQIIV